jgi:hypothetical protein
MENFEGQQGMEESIFNLNNESFANPPKSQGGLGLYKPGADQGRDGVYKAVIRFLPWHVKPSESKIHKYYVWVVDPVAGQSFSVDCPSTVGQKSILKDTYWKLKNSTDIGEQQLAENFSRAENYYSLVQIIKDPNKPDLEGKIMVFQFGAKINQKIELQLKPAVEGATSCNPYDLFDGKMFSLHITKKQKWNNYDLCEFVGDRCAITLPGEKAPIQRNKADMDRVLDWLKKESPDLNKFKYKEWDDEVREKVTRAIRNNLGTSGTAGQLLDSSANSQPSAAAVKATAQSVSDVANVSTTPIQQSAPQKAAGSLPLDDLYAGL